MGRGTVVLMTDHGSEQRSRVPMENAVELLTGAPPLSIDAGTSCSVAAAGFVAR